MIVGVGTSEITQVRIYKSMILEDLVPGQIYSIEGLTSLYRTPLIESFLGVLYEPDIFCFRRHVKSYRRTMESNAHVLEILTCSENPVIGYIVVYEERTKLIWRTMSHNRK